MLAGDAPQAAGQIINMADGRHTTLLRLLKLLSQMLEIEIQPDFQPPRVGDVRESLADISRARLLLNYEPAVTLEVGLRQTIDYYREQANQKLANQKLANQKLASQT